ncbi:hypothetical protein PR048_024201 [Dryococelus australis]|uniref:Ribosomal protein L2 n=1 Tax=Dryococelus australis TaxID=614101 RepID=A0ABQ9GWC0_9NEOP|nr:hypothetical protein PR048_024201 [Dryococelus australis]
MIGTENYCTIRVPSWTGDRDVVHLASPKLAAPKLYPRSAATVDKCSLKIQIEQIELRSIYSEKYAYFHDVIYYEPIAKFVSYLLSISHFGTKLDESKIQNHEISLMQHFYIGTKIKLYPGLELGSFDFGSRKMLVQPGISHSLHKSARLPPRLTGFNPRPVSFPGFRMWESCLMMSLVCGFSRGSPVSPVLSFRRCSILTTITLISSQYLSVKSLIYIFTHSQCLFYRHRATVWKLNSWRRAVSPFLCRGEGVGKEKATAFITDQSQHSPGVISGNHGRQKSRWPDRESNPDPPECQSSELPPRHLARTLIQFQQHQVRSFPNKHQLVSVSFRSPDNALAGSLRRRQSREDHTQLELVVLTEARQGIYSRGDLAQKALVPPRESGLCLPPLLRLLVTSFWPGLCSRNGEGEGKDNKMNRPALGNEIHLPLDNISTTHEAPPLRDDSVVLAADWLTSSVVWCPLVTVTSSSSRLSIVQSRCQDNHVAHLPKRHGFGSRMYKKSVYKLGQVIRYRKRGRLIQDTHDPSAKIRAAEDSKAGRR